MCDGRRDRDKRPGILQRRELPLRISLGGTEVRLGRIEQVGSALDVYNRPANRFVGEFIGDSNFFAGRCDPARPGLVELAGIGPVRVASKAPLPGILDKLGTQDVARAHQENDRQDTKELIDRGEGQAGYGGQAA